MASIELTVGAVDGDTVHAVDGAYRVVQLPRSALGDCAIGTVLRLAIAVDTDKTKNALVELLSAQERIAAALAVPLDPTAVHGHADVLQLVDRAHTALTFRWPPWPRIAAVARGAASRDILAPGNDPSSDENEQWRTCAPCVHAIDTICNGSVVRGPNTVSRDETVLRLTGLDAGATYALRMRFRTSAGDFETNEVVAHTPSWEDMACLRVCLVGGDSTARSELSDTLAPLGAAVVAFADSEPISAEVARKCATHVVCLGNTPPEGLLAQCKAASVPVLRREWVAACVAARKMQPVSRFYYM